MGSYELARNKGELNTVFENLSPEKWNKLIDDLFADFPTGSSEGVLTTYFLRSTYPKIGGQILRHNDGDSRFWGLLMPRKDSEGNNWTLRTYLVDPGADYREKHQTGILTFLHNLDISLVFWYETSVKRRERFSGKIISRFGDFDISFPDTDQAKGAEDLQRRIWNVTDPAYIYPFDLYGPDAGLASRLVAVYGSEVIGFLFGFYGYGLQWTGNKEEVCTWIESQLLGVEPKYRRMGIARKLKLVQREQALKDGMRLVRWTVDPLQAGNAFLNLNELGGMAAHFYPDYYPFRNDLNQVRASRIAISWFLESKRVEERVSGKKEIPGFKDLKFNSSTEVIMPVNFLRGKVRQFDILSWEPQGENLLIQIPSDWNKLQEKDIDLAMIWRDATDILWEKILGVDEDHYALVGIVKNPEDSNVFMVAQRSAARLIDN